MKMTINSRAKRRWILASLILALVLAIVGLFFVQKQKITADAATSTDSTVLYWGDGASANLDSTNMYQLRFPLHVSQAAFSSTTDNLLFIFADNSEGSWTDSAMYADGCAFNGDESTIPASTISAYKNVIWVNYQNITFDTSGWAVFKIVVDVPLQQEVAIKAMITKNGLTDVHQTAISSTRSLLYVLEKAIEYEDPALEFNPYAEEVVEFATSGRSSFEIQQGAQLDAEHGIRILLNIPQEYLDEIKKGEHYYTSGESYGGKRYWEQKFLVISRTTDSSDYTSDSAYTSQERWFFGLDSTDIFTGISVEKLTTFGSGTVGTVSLPVPSSSDTEENYYYYATIANVTRCDQYVYFKGWQTQSITAERLALSVNYYQTSVKALAENILTRDLTLTEEEMAWLQSVAGIVPSTKEVTVQLVYKYLSDSSNPASISDYTDTFFVDGVIAWNKNLVMDAMYNLKDFSSIAGFNVIYAGRYWYDGYVYNTGDKIVLQAKDIEYSYDSSTETGTMTIVYNDFQYKDLGIRIKNNDPENPLEMVYYLGAGDVTVGDTETVLRYDFSEIEETLLNSCRWIFDMTEVQVENKTSGSAVTLYEQAEINGETQNTALIVKFSDENALAKVSLTSVVEIIENVEYTVTYEYTKLRLNGNGEITETQIKSESFTKLYTEITAYNFTNFMIDYGDIINKALCFDELEGEYFIPVSIRKDMSSPTSEDLTCNYVVQYEYNTLFKITNSMDDTVSYKAMNDASLLYYGEYFVDTIPVGYRVERLESDASGIRIVKDGERPDDYTKTYVQVLIDTNAHNIVSVHIVYTDTWYLIINYMDPYKDTPFAVKTEVQTEVKVADYEDITALTKADIAAILGKTDLTIGGMVDADEKVSVVFDGISTYTATVSYGVASLRQIDYDGNTIELEIPLTSYVDWCASFGKSWTILFLNTEKTQYFKYSNEVEREKLYGFFSVAVFEEQVSDLNYWFKGNTGAGQMTIFSEREVQGSALYKFFDRLTDKGILTASLGYVGMALCEIFDDENAMYYSYYFYLDGSEQNGYAYLSNGKADDAFDDDSAFGNTVEDIWNGIKTSTKSWWESFTNSPWSTVVYVALACIAGFVLIGLGYKYVMWLRAPSTKKSKKKKRKK